MKEQDAAHSFDNNSNVTEMRTWLIHNKIELDGEFYVRFADALHAVSQFKIMKDEPPLEKGIDIVCQHCESKKAIHYANDKYFCSGCFAKEYTRLRSELQQKDKIIKELIPLAQENAEGICSISESYKRRAQAIVERAKESLKES